MRWGAGISVCALVIGGSLMDVSSAWLTTAMVFIIAGLWIGIGALSARSWHELRQLPQLIEIDPQLAEHRLAECLARRFLQRPVRLLLHHRLAMLRHRQERYAETAAICRELLGYRISAAGRVHTHLLLMLAESSLTENDMAGTYTALTQLHRVKLTLTEKAQRMALQTRYEIEMGHHQLVIAGLKDKIQLAELMPASQCGAIHAMFAVAAQRAQHPALSQWLNERALLLCGNDQLAILNHQIGFLDIPDPAYVSGSTI
jgi:hypothetical protein